MAEAGVPLSSPDAPWRRAWPVLAAAAAFGASVPFVKLWLADVPRLYASGWVYLSSGLGLGLYLLVGPRRAEPPLRRVDLPMLGLSILFGSVLAPLALFVGLAKTPGTLSSLLLNLEVVLTATLAVAFFGERMTTRRVLGTALVVLGSAGVVFVGRDEGGGAAGGGLWIAAACLCWALDNNVTRRISSRDPLQITAWKGLVGGTVSLALGLALGHDLPRDSRAWIGGAVIGVVSYGLSLVLFVYSLRAIGAARTSALFGVNPFLGLLASAFVLGEPLTPLVLGLAAVLAAGVFLLVAERGPRGAPPPPSAVP